ncbi:MAG TPA: anthranilate phosphoribosyltransferase, partial [Sphingobacteriaceae bacterium]
CDFKTFTKAGECITTLSDIGMNKINAETITGGETVEDSAKIFLSVLNGTGSVEQNNVVLSNAAVAINTIKPDRSFADCFAEAERSLLSKDALESFKKLVA